jgi:hypothetical protein
MKQICQLINDMHTQIHDSDLWTRSEPAVHHSPGQHILFAFIVSLLFLLKKNIVDLISKIKISSKV